MQTLEDRLSHDVAHIMLGPLVGLNFDTCVNWVTKRKI